MLPRTKITALAIWLLAAGYPLQLAADGRDTGYDPRGDTDASGAADIRRSAARWDAQSGLTVSIETARPFEGGAAIEFWTAYSIGQHQRGAVVGAGGIATEFDGFGPMLITRSRIEQDRSECGEVPVPVELDLPEDIQRSGQSAPVAVLKTLCASLATLNRETGQYTDVRVPSGHRYSVTIPPALFQDAKRITIRIRAAQFIEPIAIDRTEDLAVSTGR